MAFFGRSIWVSSTAFRNMMSNDACSGTGDDDTTAERVREHERASIEQARSRPALLARSSLTF